MILLLPRDPAPSVLDKLAGAPKASDIHPHAVSGATSVTVPAPYADPWTIAGEPGTKLLYVSQLVM